MAHLEKIVQKMIDSDISDHVFITFGCDFAFTNADIDYYMLDEVIKMWNKKYENKINMF
jgi:hypothetical protein